MDTVSGSQFISEYGNVASDPVRLLNTPPTPRELLEAKFQCHRAVEAAFEAIKKHYGPPKEKQ